MYFSNKIGIRGSHRGASCDGGDSEIKFFSFWFFDYLVEISRFVVPNGIDDKNNGQVVVNRQKMKATRFCEYLNKTPWNFK